MSILMSDPMFRVGIFCVLVLSGCVTVGGMPVAVSPFIGEEQGVMEGLLDSALVSPTYSNRELERGTLVIAPITGPITILNPRDVSVTGETTVEEQLASLVRSELAGRFRDHLAFEEVQVPAVLPKPYRSSPLNRDSIEAPVPGQRVVFGEVVPDYALLLQRPNLYRYRWQNLGDPGVRESVRLQTRWVLWDNRAARLVAMGTVGAESGAPNAFRSPERSWRDLHERLYESLTNLPPFVASD